MKNNNIPLYILCSTPDLARQVLEKIESESDTSFNSGLKPTSFFVEDWDYPHVFNTQDNCLTHSELKYYKDKGITNFTKAEDYLNNSMTNKTWETIEKGDILIDEVGDEHLILGTLEDIYFLSGPNEFKKCGPHLKLEELDEEGYKIKGAEEEKVSIDDVIMYLYVISGHTYSGDECKENVSKAIKMLKKLK